MPIWIRYMIFILIAAVILLGMHWVIYRQWRIALNVPPSAVWLRVVVLASAMWYIGSVAIGRSYPNFVTEIIFTGATVWLGFSVYFFLFGFAHEVVTGVAWLTKLHKPLHLEFSQLQRYIAQGSIAVAILISFWGIVVAHGKFTIRQVEHYIPNLDPALDGFKIVMVSDIHIGAIHREGFMQKVAAGINARKPDLVLIPGDVADGDRYRLSEKVAPLLQLKTKHGVYWSTGNHEYYTGAGTVVDAMERAGVPALLNRAVYVADRKLIIAGVNDPTDRQMGGEGMRLDKALAGVDTALPIILLSHQPLRFKEAFAAGVDVMLSGHTHGGQTWPFNYIVNRIWPVPRGIYRQDNSMLYVSVGIGTWGPPMRLGQPPEIVEIVLRPGQTKEYLPGRNTVATK
ncbi:MAG: metallophosphoesterase [bacterium]|nr:metallophosphoesterase [bacterium]